MKTIGAATAASGSLADRVSGTNDNTTNPETNTPAQSLIDKAIHRITGQVYTRALAGWVVDASRQDFKAANASHNQIEAQLAANNPADAAHFTRQVRNLASDAVPGPTITGAAQGMIDAGAKVLVKNPILSIQEAK